MAYEVIAELTLGPIFSHARVERIIQQASWNDSLPDLLDVLEASTEMLISQVISDILPHSGTNDSSNIVNDQSIFLSSHLETMTVQTALINHYIDLSIFSSTLSVTTNSLVSYHLKYVRLMVSQWVQRLNSIISNMGSNSNLKGRQFRALRYWSAHADSIVEMIDTKKPSVGFADPRIIPRGPPI